LEHHGYDLSHWIQTDIDNNDDEISDVEMEDIKGYTVSDFVGEDDVVIPNRDLAEGRSGGKKGKKGDWPYKKEKDEDELPKKDKGKLLRAPKKGLVDRNPNSWCIAFFKTDRGCATYENGISESYHNSIRIARAANLGDSITPSIRKEIERLKHSQRYWTVYPCVISLSSGWFIYVAQTSEEPPLSPVLRKIPGHNKKGCNKEKQPKPTVEKRAPRRKKAGSNFVFQTCDKDGGDADPSSAGPSVGDPSSADPIVADPSSAGPSVADSSSAGPSMVEDLVLTRHETWMMFLQKNDVLLCKSVYAF
nr:hypothetical protein [Tanacetum cinerariifolium]